MNMMMAVNKTEVETTIFEDLITITTYTVI